MDADPVVRVRGLWKSFGDHTVLQGVDLDLGRAENLVVLGRSGAGKSVLIRILVGLLAPDAGEVEVLGERVHALRRGDLERLRRRVGFAFQHGALYDSMNVRENLEFPLTMNVRHLTRREIDARVDRVLDGVGLPAAGPRMPSELSGGQRKRIGIARTLILEPEIMLYDEPTAGLDPVTSTEINDLILQVRQTHHTSAIIITHDLTCAKVTGDRVAMLLEGRVHRQGTFDEVFAAPDPRIREFYDYNHVRAAGAP